MLRSPKVFERNGMLFGVAGEIAIGQILKQVYDLPAPDGGQDPEQFAVQDLCWPLRKFLREQAPDLLPAADDDELWNILVAVAGRIFRICSHLSVYEPAIGYDALGSGSPYALGSLASTEGRSANDRVDIALRAAERHHGGVAGPFTVLHLGSG